MKHVGRFSSFLVLGLTIGVLGTILIMGEGEQTKATPEETEQDRGKVEETNVEEEQKVSKVKAGGEIFANQGCIQCHAVSDYNVEGGQVGPDLSNAYSDVPNKHGKSLDEFLKEPTSAVMSTVINDNPLSDEDRKSIVEALKKVSE